MAKGMMGRVVLGVWLGCLTVTAAQLPPEILADRHLVRAQRLLSEDKPWAALAEMDKIITLQKDHGLTLPEDFHFKHAQVAFAAGRTESAIDSVNKYLVGAGRGGEFYREALDLLDSAEEEMRKAEAELRQAEAERKRIEAERRRVEALQRENAGQAKRQIEAAWVSLARDPLRSGGYAPEMITVTKGRYGYAYPHNWKGTPSPWASLKQSFAISKHEVTLGDFKRFVKASRYRPDSENGGGCASPHQSSKKLSWKRPGFDQADNHPVVCVSRKDAISYAEWLSQETGRSYRLPTIVEWQYAARAGSDYTMMEAAQQPKHCGKANLSDTNEDTWFIAGKRTTGLRCLDGTRFTAQVGSFSPNGIGLHDMIGNVWEWVSTCWEDVGSSWRTGTVSSKINNCEYGSIVGGGFENGVGGFANYSTVTGYSLDRGSPGKIDLGFRLVKDL